MRSGEKAKAEVVRRTSPPASRIGRTPHRWSRVVVDSKIDQRCRAGDVRHGSHCGSERDQIGSSIARQRCWDADHDRSSSAKLACVGGGEEAASKHLHDIGISKIVDV